MSSFAFNPDFELPALDSKETVLELIRKVSTAGLHGIITPRQQTALLYSLQVALSVMNSDLPNTNSAALRAASAKAEVIYESRNRGKK